MLDRGHDRRGVVLAVVHYEPAPEPGRDRERRDARTRTPRVVRTAAATLARRRHMVPLAAELVVGHDHHRVLAAPAPLDRLDQLDEVVAAVRLARVAGMLVLGSDRLDERDGAQPAARA